MKTFKDILSSEYLEYVCITTIYHLIVLLGLALVITKPDIIDRGIEILSYTEDFVPQEQIIDANEIIQFSDETSISEQPIDLAESSLQTNPEIEIPSAIDVEPISENTEFVSSNLLNEVISGIGSSIGAGISNQTSTGGALDRLTIEIVDNAQTRNINVVWLFDASVSLTNQRQNIYSRFAKILQEIELSNPKHDVNHAICSFGNGIKFLTEEPTNNIDNLKRDISLISIDDSGVENTFNAIGQACKKYYKPNTRSLIIVFTDEIGNDISLSDSVGSFARMKNCVVYVVGSPAPFGKNTTQFKFVEFDPQYESAEKWVQIEQGPETLDDMILDLHSLPIDDEVLDSGFGPFALCKLCCDTGGIFFSIHPNRSSQKLNKKEIDPLSSYISRFFDHQTMMLYKPDYRSIGVQNKENSTHITKRALLAASKIPINITGEQILRFKAFNEGMFAEELNMAQRFSAKVEPKLNEVYNILLSGEFAHLSLTDKRWLASYSLAMGRILATKCRIEAYNLTLAEAKSGLKKKDPKSNIWILMHDPQLQTSNSNLRKNYDAANKYLKFVVDNFPNTPWSLIANEELNTPMGYSWVEEYQEPPKPNNGGGGNNRPKDDMLKPKLIPKPQRKIDKI